MKQLTLPGIETARQYKKRVTDKVGASTLAMVQAEHESFIAYFGARNKRKPRQTQ